VNDIPIESISKLSLAPDDVVILRTEMRLSSEQREWLQTLVKRQIPPSNKVMVLEQGLRLEVLSPQAPLTEKEIAERWFTSMTRHMSQGFGSKAFVKAVVEDFARSIERRGTP
jgi:hypothetical protein